MKLRKMKKGIGQLYKVYQDQCKGYLSEEEMKKANVQKLFKKLKLEAEDLKEAEDRGKWLKDRIDEKRRARMKKRGANNTGESSTGEKGCRAAYGRRASGLKG